MASDKCVYVWAIQNHLREIHLKRPEDYKRKCAEKKKRLFFSFLRLSNERELRD